MCELVDLPPCLAENTDLLTQMAVSHLNESFGYDGIKSPSQTQNRTHRSASEGGVAELQDGGSVTWKS